MADTLTTHRPARGVGGRLAPLPDGVAIVERPFVTMVELRVDPFGPGSAAAAELLGVELPTTACTYANNSDTTAIWLGPDEWLVTALAPRWLGQIWKYGCARPCRRTCGAAVDVSGQRTTLRLRGSHTRDVLAKGCALDLHPRVFTGVAAAQTTLGQAGVILLTVDGGGADYRILVRSSFARYLAGWLLDAGDRVPRHRLSGLNHQARPADRPTTTPERPGARMSTTPRVVIIGAGIVGTSLADELTARGVDRTSRCVDQGPLSADRRLDLARARARVPDQPVEDDDARSRAYTVEKFSGLDLDGGVVLQPGRRARGRHHARTLGRPAPPAGLGPTPGASRSPSSTRTSASGCTRCWTASRSSAASTPRPTGWRRPSRAAEAQARRARCARGARSWAAHRRARRSRAGGWPRHRRRAPSAGVIDADVVVCVRRLLGRRRSARMVGLDVPLLPMAHQYAQDRAGRRARRAQRRGESRSGLPILRHQDADLYFREHVDRLGIGYYGHQPMPVDLDDLDGRRRGDRAACRRCCRSPRRTSTPAWRAVP